MQIEVFTFRIVFGGVLFWGYLVVFIAIIRSSPNEGISTYFLLVPLFCAHTWMFDISSWINQNCDYGET